MLPSVALIGQVQQPMLVRVINMPKAVLHATPSHMQPMQKHHQQATEQLLSHQVCRHECQVAIDSWWLAQSAQ